MNRHKDKAPTATVFAIRNILQDLGLFTFETWFTSAPGVYSVFLRISHTDIYANGKGTSREYALASGYGELIERIQNQHYFKKSLPAARAEESGCLPPNEYIDDSVTAATVRSCFQAYCSYSPSFAGTEAQRDLDALADLWRKAVLSERQRHRFSTYTRVDNPEETISLPEPVEMLLFASNGMCAGNTREEAFVQGICEIFERYAIQQVFREELVPPLISNDKLTDFTLVNQLITSIEEKSGLRVILKDLSLGVGLPVVAVIFFDQDDNYFVTFGSHPNIEVAIERCLTEFHQGKDGNTWQEVMRPFVRDTDSTRLKSHFPNLRSIFACGQGDYPYPFFSRDGFSYKPGLEFRDFNNNQEMLEYLLGKVRDLNCALFAKDVSFLGFPSYQLIIPGLSEISRIDDTEALACHAKKKQCLNTVLNLADASEEELRSLLQFLADQDETDLAHHSPQSFFKSIPFANGSTYNQYPLALLMCFVSIALKQYRQALAPLTLHLDSANNFLTDSQKDLQLLSRLLTMAAEGLDEKAMIDILTINHGQARIDRVLALYWHNPLKLFPKFICPQCDRCELKDGCSHISLSTVGKRLKMARIANSLFS